MSSRVATRPSPARSASRRRWAAALLTLPSWILIVLLFAIPIGVGVYLSFRSDKIGGFVPGQFVGLDNYRRDVVSDVFVEALYTTLLITLLGLVIQVPAGIGLGVILHQNLRGTRLFRSVLLLPMLLTPVAVGLMWRFMFDIDVGVINWLLESAGLSRIGWLGEKWSARMAVVLVDSWLSTPFIMLMTLAGLSALPEAPLEAAQVDGATGWKAFWFVTLPMLRPVLYVALMIRIVDSLKLFDIIFILTRGGPGRSTQTLGLLGYNTGFNFLETGRASAIGVATALITIPVYLLWMRAQRAAR